MADGARQLVLGGAVATCFGALACISMPGGGPSDGNPGSEADRMCWHTGGGFLQSGFRCGDNNLNGSSGFERIVLSSTSGGPIQAARSCSEIKAQSPGVQNGIFNIDPDGPGGRDPYLAECDMTTDGGGWTLAFASGGQGPDFVPVGSPRD